jgi:hypothetical protein
MRGNRLIERIAYHLKNLFRMSSGTSISSSSFPQTDVLPEESLSTFVTKTNQIVKKTNTIHHSRLIPRRNKNKNGRLETSVCRSQSLSDSEIWAICSAHFDVHAQAPAIGRGVGPAKAIFDCELGFDADGNPYAEHANIIGWYDAAKPDNELKHFWMDKAQKMAPTFRYLPRQNLTN